jgi:hypothetical protein
MQRETYERLLRGGTGSAIVHGMLAALLLLPLGAPAVQSPQGTPADVIKPANTRAPAVRRNSDLPFARDTSTTSRRIPLAIENGPGGADFIIDLARIRERRNDLFPFVTWELPFLRERPGTDGPGGLEFQIAMGAIPPAGGPPLTLTPARIQALVDRAWSRRHRWSNLEELVTLSDRYHPDRGDLPTLFREYARQNVPQPYEDWSDPDPVYWVTLMLAADDAPLVEFVSRYTRRHPASRTTTELLFLLDASAEASCDVLLRVLRAGTGDLPLQVTRFDNPDAYRLAQELASAYRTWVIRHQARLPDRCNTTRVDILRRIIDTSPDGYGAGDARFRLGQLLWLSNRRVEAVEWWAGMQADGRSQYATAQRALLGALADGAADSQPSRISGILRDEELRWQIAARERLEHLGCRPTEF